MLPLSTSSIPSWLRSLAAPAWIVVDGGVLGWMNERAEVLLGKSLAECAGQPCHRVVGGFDPYCRAFCRSVCHWRRRLREGRVVEPFVIQPGGRGSNSPWCQVLPIVVEHDGEEPWLVHCALDLSRAEMLAEYLSKVASRTPHRDFHTYPELQRILTERELEILSLLAQDRTLHDIADSLNVSYITVRNHVQHVQQKLETHTIQQAVALYLLAWDRP